MRWEEYQAKMCAYAESDRKNPIEIGYLLVKCETDFQDFEDRILQLVSYFPQKKQQTVNNWRSICKSYDRTLLPSNVRISQMDTCRTLPEEKKYEYLNWAAENDFGREDIQARMLTEGLLIPRQDDVEKLIKCALGKLDKALPIAPARMQAAIKLAVNVLQDGLK
jgi:hypothetical protein